MADSVGVLVVAGGAAASADLCVVDCVEWAGGACSLEHELVGIAGEDADSAAAQGVAVGADTFSVGDHLVVATSIAVALAVQELISFALADTG